MLVYILLSRWVYNFKVEQATREFSSFGFESNGTFQISIRLTRPAAFTLTLESAEERHTRVDGSTALSYMCTNMSYPIAKLNASTTGVTGEFEWTDSVRTRGVYYLSITFCQGRGSDCEVSAFYINPNSFLDYRDELFPLLYLGICGVWICVTFAWIANGLLYHRFHIDAHSACVCASLARVVDLFMKGIDWSHQRNGSSDNVFLKMVGNASSGAFWTVVLAIPVLVTAGWGTYDESIPAGYVMFIGSGAMVAVCTMMLATEVGWYSDEMSFRWILCVMMMFGIAIYGWLYAKAIDRLLKAMRRLLPTDRFGPVMKKIEMVLKVNMYVVWVVGVVCICEILIWFEKDMRVAWLMDIIEVEVVAVMSMMACVKMLMLKDEHVPPEGDDGGDLDALDAVPAEFRKIEDPLCMTYAFTENVKI